MRVLYFSLLTIIATLLLASCESQPKKIATLEDQYPFPLFDPQSASPTPKIEKGCETPQLDLTILQEPRPEFPVPSMRQGKAGYVVFDFRINSEGRASDIELVAEEGKGLFEKNSRDALKKLLFSIGTRSSACLNQKYRVGYAFRLMTKCKSNEFPADITGICTASYFARTRKELDEIHPR